MESSVHFKIIWKHNLLWKALSDIKLDGSIFNWPVHDIFYGHNRTKLCHEDNTALSFKLCSQYHVKLMKALNFDMGTNKWSQHPACPVLLICTSVWWTPWHCPTGAHAQSTHPQSADTVVLFLPRERTGGRPMKNNVHSQCSELLLLGWDEA